MKILVINGPNLNLLGRRDPAKYGRTTLNQINRQLKKIAEKKNIELEFYFSNHEGQLIDFLQMNSRQAVGILINPGALTHYGYSLRDALEDCQLPIAEVHLTDIDKREPFRKINVLKSISIIKIQGQKENSYYRALNLLIKLLLIKS
ncbi:hypothetical protein A2W14_01840 [Candidatus Gottesmanbacteria bacterium RBG_16_37_8]|uniref:3-dehydroquinate dehydratase n=1 Tax=Candidatus Gottesmanbacteria bacterium RBG_16_37_8 TaxID=1798371 RepID=A0A1F5YU00_9BACT|nr:MAG: hypothetical protein A2W14_01840 [Candidatus Gottesmanbacteria bacterium RBG_16_37_8]